ncbi:LysM peptidoglycan-binding domain-containing protein [Limosilactobacillus reuteri]|uniref:LysM peptidoglycan-binding domain-containing protein n=1 Tax=Limosilactobacillus reuteri TaxID=1598 RepID=UPI001E316A0B|nr:LysM domain-containing protein [Limosilactobacillus reuteri]MCC4328770.1 LysM peptidoglycan-binding domain-containing protein [Limosilactobacillus reuteri]MCC4336545.1 LysM peptidoglycan-binding domain-containing protein [Limosilactobacillus reuteri]MCC4338999.1 LysM peptidoglycan-binding domain-containing protein [Limosilactobacillus reuteri]
MKLSKKQLAATFMTAVLAGSVMIGSVATVEADNASGSPEEQADITNWIANTPEQISNNMAMQHINTNNLNGTRYIIQWGDTLSGISAATGISVAKLCYDNNIQNANLIFAGDVLILNREGSVPAGYDPNVNPNVVAQTKITINNGPTTVNIAVQPQSVVKNYDNSDNSDHSTTIYKAGAVNSFNNNDNDNEQSASQSSSTKSAKHQKHTSSVSASDIVSGLNDANNNDKLSFDEGDGGSDADELNVDSAAILKDAKKNDYDAIISEIESALGSKAKKDTTIYIEKDGSEIHVYASVNDDDSSNSSSAKSDKEDDSSSSESESSDDSSQSSSDDEDSSSQATTSDHDTNTSDDE